MKLQEQIQEIKRLMMEATSSSSSGSYEAPLPVDAPEEVGTVISVEVMDDAPEVDVVDITMSDDMEPCPNCGEPECPGCEDEYMDLEDVFNSLNLFTETTIKEQEAVAGMEAETVMGVDRMDVDDMVVKFVKEKRTVGPEFVLQRIAGCPGPLFPLNLEGSLGGAGDSVFPGRKDGTLEIVYKGKTYHSENICGGMDKLVKSFLDPSRKRDFLKLINEFLENRTGGVMNMTYDQLGTDGSERRMDKFRWKDTGGGNYALVKM